jgi:hypothetical protein
MVAVTLVEAGYATFAEWKDLIGGHVGFFNYDPETCAYLSSDRKSARDPQGQSREHQMDECLLFLVYLSSSLVLVPNLVLRSGRERSL